MDDFKHEIRVSLLVFGAVVLFFGTFMFFAKSQMLKLSGRIADVQSLISQKRTIASQLINLREDKELAAQYETTINYLIPTNKQLFDLQKWLSNQAQAFGLGITFNYSGSEIEPEKGSLGTLPFSMKLSGDLGDVAVFLDFLENKTPQFLMSFDSLSVGAVQGGTNQVALNGKVYFRPNE